jgi:hypothetical protein
MDLLSGFHHFIPETVESLIESVGTKTFLSPSHNRLLGRASAVTGCGTCRSCSLEVRLETAKQTNTLKE